MNLEDRLAQVREEYIRRIATASDGSLLLNVQQYVTAHTGKMLRPRMLLLAANTLGETVFNSRRTLHLATCVEMLHNASLLHDDIIDHSDQRRSQPSVNAKYGNGVAVLAGDYLLAQIMHLLNEVNDSEASKMINRTVMDMVESELLAQELEINHRELTQELYLRIIDGKTASLFATAAALGNSAYRDYGLHYGRLFQLLDDQQDGEDNRFTAQLIDSEREILASLPQLPMQ